MIKAAFYGRYSTDKQSDASIEDQLRQCERCAQVSGLSITARFEDRGISAGTAARPGYQAMLEAARRHEFEIIVVEDVSRLWRNKAEYGPRSAELEDLGVHCITCVGDDTRRDGYGLVFGMKQLMAEHARREISYRTRRGMEGLALAGKSTGGRCYGYATPLTVDPAEAEIVRRIFNMAAIGASRAKIATELNNSLIPTVRGGAWSQSSVNAILMNRRYTGAVEWGASSCRGLASDSRVRRRIMSLEGPLAATQREDLRIISEELWAQSRYQSCKEAA